MNCYSAEAMEQVVAQVMWALLLGSFLACAGGAFVGRAAYWCLFLFVRRSPRFRRFDRAMRKVMA